VEVIADAIRTEFHGQYALYGHSMGALLSFELARELRRRKYDTPVHLFLSGCGAPDRVGCAHPTFNLPIQEFMAELQKLNGTPKEFFDHPEIQSALLPLLRADFEITDTYRYMAESPLACPITVYGGEQDDVAKAQDLAGWEMQTAAECKIRFFAGDHFFIQSHKAEFVRILRQDLLQTFCMAPAPSTAQW
jgi:medium-chain acyl-[acyl-carrier-protein] hydrolase